MKKIFRGTISLLVLMLVYATVLAQARYTCPMHPEVRSDSAGQCPKCGMTLQPLSGQPADTGAGNTSMATTSTGHTVRSVLYITDTLVNYTGKSRHAYAINGSIPGPELVFTEGDTAEIYLHNQLKKEETSLHWHGVILPNRFDGVPYLTTSPVHPGEVHLYRFPVKQTGTYWYHSHSGLQEQAGIYGALIFRKRGQGRSAQDPMQSGQHNGHEHQDMHQNMQHQDMQHPRPRKEPMKDSAQQHQKMQEHQEQDHEGQIHEGQGHQEKGHEGHMPPMADGSYNKELTLVLSEWTDEKPEQVQRRLRTANDWYAIQKKSTQSYSEAIAAGHLGTKLTNEWKRMHAMDVSDVYYDRFLINGQPDSQAPAFGAGDRVRLRVVNAGASSYFWLGWGGGKMTVVANDGNDVQPVEVDRLIIGVSETYDVVVSIPENMQYEFRATAEDRSKAASLWLGKGMKMPAPVLPRLNYFEGMKMMNGMMKMNGDMKEMDMPMSLQRMDMNRVMYPELGKSSMQGMDHSQPGSGAQGTHQQHQQQEQQQPGQHQQHGQDTGMITLNYGMLQSTVNTTLPDTGYQQLEFELTGNMNRYVWSIDNKVVREWDKILIEKGRNVRVILFNNSMMRHPMHLHGHEFRVINGKGAYAPKKNVLDIMPMERDTLEFYGSEDGDWFFHCHILYHMMAGMGNVFSYANSEPNPELPDKVAAYNKFLRHHSMWHLMAEIGLESNGSDGRVMLQSDRYELRTEWRLGIKSDHGYESETYFGRYLGRMQWWFPFIGFDYHKNNRDNSSEKNVFGQLTNQNNRKALMAGIEYVLPMLVRAQARVDSKGKFRFQLSREDIPLTPRLRLNALWNTDREYMAGLQYVLRKWLSLSTHYDSDMGYGAGITLQY